MATKNALYLVLQFENKDKIMLKPKSKVHITFYRDLKQITVIGRGTFLSIYGRINGNLDLTFEYDDIIKYWLEIGGNRISEKSNISYSAIKDFFKSHEIEVK